MSEVNKRPFKCIPSPQHSVPSGRRTAEIAGGQKAGGVMSFYKPTLAQQSLRGVGGRVGKQYKGHTCTKQPNVTWRYKNTSWTHHHLILDKLNCLNRGGSKMIMFQWSFVYWHHLISYDIAMVTGKNTLLLAFRVKWLQLMRSLC